MSAAPPRPRRRRVTVVACSLAGNGAGRVQVLAELASHHGDVEIASPVFIRRAASLWPPLAENKIARRTFDAVAMQDFIPAAMRFVQDIECDAVVVSKARFASMLIGMLIKHRLGCPAVLDNDDWELAFFPGARPLAVADIDREPEGSSADMPFDSRWTAIAESLVGSFEDRAVASCTLQRRFGGVMIRHARSQRSFRFDPAKRKLARRKFGIGADEVVVLFLGTPRPHKGLIEVAEAIGHIGDPRLRLVVVGTVSNAQFAEKLSAFPHVSLHPNQPWSELPRVVQLADGVCLFQDPTSPVSTYQIPAKLSDALAIGIEVAATPTPALADIPDGIITRLQDTTALDHWLRSLLVQGTSDEDRARRRAWFIQELSYGVNAARLDLLLREAEARRAGWPVSWTELFAALNRRYKTCLPEAPPPWAEHVAA